MQKVYDLEKRTENFSKEILQFCKDCKKDMLTKPLLLQLIRSATSIGANYMEANGVCSKKDFANKIFICKKEAQETKYWLNLLLHMCEEKKDLILPLQKECQELVLIFNKIASSSQAS